MIELQIKHADGNTVLLNFPSEVKDITLRQYIAYERHIRSAPSWYTKGENESGEPLSQRQIAHWMVLEMQSLSHLSGVDINQLLQLEIGDIDAVVIDQTAIESVLDLSAYLHSVVSTYQPKLRQYFEFRGQTYYFPVKTAQRIASQGLGEELDFKRLTVQEYVDINNFNHYWGGQDTERGDFQKVLGMLSVLCRQEGELLPLPESEHDDFVSERLALFQDIPMDIGLDVWFFFVNTRSTYEATHSLQTLLNRLPKSSQKQQQP